MFDSHSRNISDMDALDRELNIRLPENTRLLFIDDDYVNYLYFTELLENSGGEIIRTVSVSQALFKLKLEKNIKIIYISAPFAGSFDYKIIRFLKDKYLSIPIVTIIDNQSREAQQRCLEEGSDCCIDRHIDSDHLIESIMDLLESSLFINYSHP